MPNNFTPDQTGFSRVFILEGRAGPTHAPNFQSCMMAGGVSHSLGDVEKIECPSSDRYDDFVAMGEVTGAEDRPTSSLTGRYAADLASKLLELKRRKCPNDVQIHIGVCTDPSAFDVFSKNMIWEGARITDYSTEDLGALSSDQRAAVNESVDLSMEDFYEVLQLTFQRHADDTITNELVDVVVCDQISCGDCEDESFGCEKIYAVSLAAGGSPGTPADVVFSLDKGVTWFAHDVDTLQAAEDPTGIACVGIYIVVVSNDSCSLHYAEKADITNLVDPVFTEQATGFVAGNCPNDIWSVGTLAFIVGDNGYVYSTSDPTGGVSVVDAGVATSLDLEAVHALDANFAVAVGDSGAIVMTANGTTWSVVTPTNVLFTQNWHAVWVKNEREWWIGGATVGGVGQLWYTLDGGVTWFMKGADGNPGLPGTYIDIEDISFASDSVMYVSGTIAGPRGRILRSFNGGYTFLVLPEGTSTMPLADQFTAIAACSDDENFVVGVGLADDGADGILVIGQD